MGTLNPYQPPSGSVPSGIADSPEYDTVQPRLLPHSFWFVWSVFVATCAVLVAVVLYLARADRNAVSFLGLPLWGLFLTPFVAVRAKLCERYQHRCMGSSGIVIFLACFSVCFGLFYASIGIAFFVWMFLSAFMTNKQFLNGLKQNAFASCHKNRDYRPSCLDG